MRQWRDPKQRDKMCKGRLGRKQSAETQEKKRQARLGYRHSPETRERLRQTALGRKIPPEQREKIRQARLRQRFPLTDIEEILRYEFKKRRLKFEMHKAMFDAWQPDFVFGGARLIVQADGAYWHNRRHPRNVAHDEAFNARAAEENWTVFRFTGREIKEHPAACAKAVATYVRHH